MTSAPPSPPVADIESYLALRNVVLVAITRAPALAEHVYDVDGLEALQALVSRGDSIDGRVRRG